MHLLVYVGMCVQKYPCNRVQGEVLVDAYKSITMFRIQMYVALIKQPGIHMHMHM